MHTSGHVGQHSYGNAYSMLIRPTFTLTSLSFVKQGKLSHSYKECTDHQNLATWVQRRADKVQELATLAVWQCCRQT